jgi:hypothetical protein
MENDNMAKDDYFRIVYIILRFLYENMKKGKVNVTLDELMENCNIPDIPKEYFDEILLIFLKRNIEIPSLFQRGLTNLTISLSSKEFLMISFH